MRSDFDCLVIGGGPAGLTAAIYLSRFHLNVRLVDEGRSRALWIPCSHNHAGFPNGITGRELISRMREQAVKYGTSVASARVTRLDICEGSFTAEWGEGEVCAKTVLLATGVQNRRPSIDERLHEEALEKGLLRYCPVCDGFEATDANLAVIGTGERGLREATFLRSFSSQVTLIAPGDKHDLKQTQRGLAETYGIALMDGPARITAVADGAITVATAAATVDFDTIYPALGSDINSTLARLIGADTNESGCIKVDSHQRTSVPGLYAAGDVVIGLDQISHAMGEGGVAATTIRNDLADIAPLLR